MRSLDGLNWKPQWASLLGCIQGCADYLKLGHSDAWVYGGTGHAFVLNVHEALCPSGPTAWRTELLDPLTANLGLRTEMIFGMKSEDDFAATQERAWDAVRAAVDEGLPCYGWELVIPEYYVIYGYDEAGYHVKGPACPEGSVPIPWRKAGEAEIGVLAMMILRPTPAASDEKVVGDALRFALDFDAHPEGYGWEPYARGLAAYDQWMAALPRDDALGMGVAYNAQVWAECRRNAWAFLSEAAQRLPAVRPLLDEAAGHYRRVGEHLEAVATLYPFVQGGPDAEEQMQATVAEGARREEATPHLQAARDAEAQGLQVLARVVEALEVVAQ